MSDADYLHPRRRPVLLDDVAIGEARDWLDVFTLLEAAGLDHVAAGEAVTHGESTGAAFICRGKQR